MSRATWSRPTSERLAVRRRHERVDPIPEKFACGRATRMGARTASPLPSRRVPARCLHIGVRVTRACGRWARRSYRCTSRAGEGRCWRSLRPRRTPRPDMRISFARRSSRFSLDHGCVRPRPRSPRDRPSSMSAWRARSGPTPPRSRASSPPVRSHRPLSRSRRHVGRRGARRARSLRRCRSATTGLSRARSLSRSLDRVVMAPPSTHGEALQGNQ